MSDAKLTVDTIAELQNEIATQREVICNLNAMNDELQAKLDKIEQIQPKNGKVILPQWCEYQFGEISNVIIGNQGEH